MRPTVITNFVAFTRRPRHDLRILCHFFAHDEESGFDVVRDEYIQQLRRKLGIRTIIKGYGNVWLVYMNGVE